MSKEDNGAEGAHLTAEQEFRLLVETIPTLVWRAAPEGNVEYVNKRALDYFGAPVDEILGWGWMDKVHPDDIAYKARTWLNNLQSETPHDAVCRFRAANGEYRWFNVRGEPLRADDGRVLRWYGVLIDIDDRRKAEEALRESQYKLRQILETVPTLAGSTGSNGSEVQKAEVQPIMAQVQAVLNVLPAYAWYAAPSGALTFVNKRTADYLCIPEGHPLRSGIDTGAQWDDWIPLLHPDDREGARKYWSDCLRAGEGGEHSYRVRNADGDYRWFLARFEPLRARDGTLLLWIGATLDIEELKCAEHALRESEYNLQKIIETVPGLVWSNGPDGEPTHVNRRMLDYSGMRFEEFKCHRWETFVHPADYPETAMGFYHAIQTGTSYEGVMRLRQADGNFRWHHARCEPLRDGQGNIIQWYGLSVDIDERKRAEDLLRRSEAHLAEAQRLTHIGVAAFSETEILFWSDETYRIWGFDPALGIPSCEVVAQRINPEDRARVDVEVQRALREKRRYSIDYRIVLPDGTVKHLKTIGVPEFSASGKLVEIVVTQMDVTERRHAQEEHERLRQLESDLAHMHRLSMMGELAASLAHEIAQPVATARNNARASMHFLDRSPPELAQVREALAAVVDDADRAGEILDRIRDHIRKAPPRKERVDLNQAITDVIALAQSAIIRDEVSVQTRFAEGLPYVQADRVQVQQVVLNLILNAVEAMSLFKKSVRELAISTEQYPAGGVLVAVRDSGPGIDPKYLDRVFDAFYTTKFSGVGMGLSICRSIINAHGGQLWAEANSTGGAIFRFTLPDVGTDS
jgi:PAS domain S-box-containing protein